MARILLIDDDDAIRAIFQVMLEGDGHEVFEATDGTEGLTLFEKAAPDVVITDIVMPRTEGLATITMLKKNKPNLRIIAVSGGGRVGGQDYLALAKELGASCTLTKPVRKADLISAVRDCLEN